MGGVSPICSLVDVVSTAELSIVDVSETKYFSSVGILFPLFLFNDGL